MNRKEDEPHMSQEESSNEVLGYGDWQYKPVPNWPKMPDDIDFVEAIGVTVGQDDRRTLR